MQRLLGNLMLACVVAGCGQVEERVPAVGTSNGPTLLTAACTGDESCPGGMICEGCNGPHDAQCIPGCRTDAQCPRQHVCRGPVVCFTCPCAPGWCELDPCRDVDGDGYAFTNDRSIACPGKQLGDCNDGNRAQHPGARELCANGIDDDCDGRADRNDPSCQTCTDESQTCNDASDCAGGNQVGAVKCQAGCCLSCPAVASPVCGTEQTSVGGGLDPVTACRVERKCIDWRVCANTPYDPVCGVDFATYRNPCQAQQAGVQLLHRGSCRWNEGKPCSFSTEGTPGSCESGQYCRLDATAGKRCTMQGACLVDADCPAGPVTTPLCGADGGVVWTCQQNACAARCL
jgi:hypothetical protein